MNSTHPSTPTGKTAVMLVNLGTPEAPTAGAVRRYLREFLMDPRVIEAPKLIWWFILNGPILTFRPRKVAKAYASIWNTANNESPLKTVTRAQAAGIQAAIGNKVTVTWSMRYGLPRIGATLDKLMASGHTRIVVAPLYPQYSATTTATVMDSVGHWLRRQRWQPAIRTLPPYYDHPAYIDALASSYKTHLKTLDWQPDVVLASFHGLPQQYCEKGDPYYCHCHKTARLLREKLKMDEKTLRLTFQSRFGPTQWLQPYTDKTLAALAEEGLKKVAIITPGFAADCLETLEEIAIEGQEIFRTHGGENFTVVPCLNQSDAGLKLLTTLLQNELNGWTG